MRFKKRGLFNSKRAEESHEMPFIMAELTFFAIFAYILIVFTVGIAKDTTFQKNYLARDIATTLDAIYASPNDIFYIYPSSPFNFSKYTLELGSERVKVGERDSDVKETTYWFADLSGAGFIQEKLDDITTVAINKTRGAKPELMPLLIPEG
jgi:hypothetical protein